MTGLFDGTPLERPVTCERCERPLAACACPRNAAGELTLPRDQHVRVRREKRRGKAVTVIAGLDPAANDLAGLAKDFQRRLGAGGTVKDGTIELQGDHRDTVLDELKQRGFNARAAGG
jgi:translation initiation factor 1